MPLQNRVTPEGAIIADPARGLVMGNRGGRLHYPDKTLGRRRWVSKSWIACRLDFRGRRREVMEPGSYTELFFLDEATALAAGHRPCFECRRRDALAFAAAWAAGHGVSEPPAAAVMDQVLHRERLTRGGGKRTFRARLGRLPDGGMLQHAGAAWLRVDGRMLRWAPDGYRDSIPADQYLAVEVLTPRSIIAVLKNGYVPMVHETACASR